MKTLPAVLGGENIRRTFHDGEWWFAVSDIVEALTDSSSGNDTLAKIYRRDKELCKGWKEYISTLLLESPNGRQRVDCFNTAGIFRLAQSVVSPKAERLKGWLARVGYERMRELEDPELATGLIKSIFRAKGYSNTWIAKRMYGIAVRSKLTDQWENRGVCEKPEQNILAAEISKATFGITPAEYMDLKGLEHENLRDHMTDLELIFSMLGEAATTEIARRRDAQGFGENKTACHKGGRIAGEARKKLELETGEKVVNRANYLTEPESHKRLATKKA